jgi:RNA polymerase-interacting CarD/CdnL/TRCF family regulator
MGVREDVKIILIQSGKTLKEVVELLNSKYDRNDTSQNLSNKLSRGTLKYSEAVEIAEVLGYSIKWVKEKERV